VTPSACGIISIYSIVTILLQVYESRVVRKRQDRLESNLRLLEGRWTGFILLALLEQRLRYGGIRARIPDITDRVLSRRLLDLEERGLLTRHGLSTRPPEVWYSLTKAGRDLKPVFDAIGQWRAPSPRF
jgi:DNA-binding HxlR family transcriptional regulator